MIARTDLFAGISSRNQRLLAFSAQWYEAQAGQRIFSMYEKPDAAYLCISGAGVLTYDTQDGERPVTTVEPGRLIGDLAIITNEPRQLNLTATQKSTFLRIGATEYRAVIENDPTILLSLLQTVAGHLTNAAQLLRQANIAIPQDEGPPPPPLDR